MKRCAPIANGGCNKEKPITEFGIQRGKPEPRCRECQLRFSKLPSDIRMMMWIKPPEKVCPENKRCAPINQGGCNQLLPINQFFRKSGSRGHEKRCKVCYRRWRNLTPEDRENYGEKSAQLIKHYKEVEKEKLRKDRAKIKKPDSFIPWPPADVERKYCEVGR